MVDRSGQQVDERSLERLDAAVTREVQVAEQELTGFERAQDVGDGHHLGSAFSLLTGEPNTLPAIKPVAVYSASVVDGNIVVDVDVSTPVSEGAES